MANTRELRRRIKSIKNTSQITKAMQMVAATKMRKAQEQAISGRPYKENLSISLSRLLPKIDRSIHPLLTGPSADGPKTAAVVLLSTDKGLVGALNTNLLRLLSSFIVNKNLTFYTVGRKGRSFVARSGKDLKADFENLDVITFRQAKQLGRMLMEAFKSGEIGEAYLVYPDFVSTLKQEPKIVKILPIDLEIKKDDVVQDTDFKFEPDPDTLLDFILVHHIEEQLYQSLLETKASEHSARMIAMQNATDNAKELVEDLKLTYNQTRQASITTELLEITTAQVAME